MNRTRFVTTLLAAALLVTAALTVQQAVALADFSAPPPAAQPSTGYTLNDRPTYRLSEWGPDAIYQAAAQPTCPFTSEERAALRAVFVARRGGWVTQTGAQAATGVDGGLLALRDGPLARTGTVTAAGVEGGLLALRGCRR